MRLFSRRGKDRVKGEEEVEEKVQNMKTAVMATANAVQLNEVDIVVFNWCVLRVCRSCLEISWGSTPRGSVSLCSGWDRGSTWGGGYVLCLSIWIIAGGAVVIKSKLAQCGARL